MRIKRKEWEVTYGDYSGDAHNGVPDEFSGGAFDMIWLLEALIDEEDRNIVETRFSNQVLSGMDTGYVGRYTLQDEADEVTCFDGSDMYRTEDNHGAMYFFADNGHFINSRGRNVE